MASAASRARWARTPNASASSSPSRITDSTGAQSTRAGTATSSHGHRPVTSSQVRAESEPSR